jgi:hypothetical protein
VADEEPDNLVLRYLRKLDERTARIEDGQKDLAADIRTLKGHMASFLQSETRQDSTIAAIQDRLDKIERRLDISDG